MSRKYKIRDQNKPHFISFATVNWIDVFTRRVYKDVIIESLKYCIAHKGLEVYGYCIMTNHVHLIIGSPKEKIENIIRDMKKHTSKELIKMIEGNTQESRRSWMLWMFKRAGEHNINNKNYQFWQQNNHPVELFDHEIMDQKLDYIHNNPIEAGIVENAEDYIYSSARDYWGKKGLIDLCFDK
jgi:putative transposase